MKRIFILVPVLLSVCLLLGGCSSCTDNVMPADGQPQTEQSNGHILHSVLDPVPHGRQRKPPVYAHRGLAGLRFLNRKN